MTAHDPVADLDETQQEVARLLLTPSVHGLPEDEEITLVATHAALVFLAGETVYKLRKAVDLVYLDFSTLDKRKGFAEREVRLNARTAPDLYLGVVAVTRESDGSLALGGGGEPIDWLTKMRRFDHTRILSEPAARARLTKALAEDLGAQIAAFHASEAPLTTVDWPYEVTRIQEANARDCRTHGAQIYDAQALKDFETAQSALTERLTDTLRMRTKSGVRHCHGDLHLGNIAALDDGLLIFDCIEFDDRLAHIDTLYDLAFLLMDMAEKDMRAQAARVLSAYIHHLPTEDREDSLTGLAALPLYMAMRAIIRSHIAAARGEPEEAEALFRDAGGYLRPGPPNLLAVGGLSGSGKSTLAAAVAEHVATPPGALVLRSDVLRKILAGVAPTQRLPQQAYTPEASTALYAEMRRLAALALRAGHSVILDAVHAKPEERGAAQELARDLGVPFAGLWLEGDVAEMGARVEGRSGDASDADKSVLAKQTGYDTGEITWARLTTTARSKDETARLALKEMRALLPQEALRAP